MRSLAHAGGQNLARRNVGGIENCHIQMNNTTANIYLPRSAPSYETVSLFSLAWIAVFEPATPSNGATGRRGSGRLAVVDDNSRGESEHDSSLS